MRLLVKVIGAEENVRTFNQMFHLVLTSRNILNHGIVPETLALR